MANPTNGGPQAPADAQAAPQLNVLAQYVKDFSFENPNAPRSLQPSNQQPQINIQINVNASPLQSDFEIDLKIEGKAEIVESDSDDVVRSERLTLPKPAIIRLMKFVHVPRRFRRQVTNTFLFARDGYRCQYCHRGNAQLRHRECLTRDHLIPLSRGGDNEWNNVVTACSTCNTRKGNHLPEECGMHPHAVPREPHFVHLSWAVRRLSSQQAKYIKLFYGEEALKALGGTI